MHNAKLSDLAAGCTVRSWRTAPSAWVIDTITSERAYMTNLYDVTRTASLPLAASVWAVTFPSCLVEN